MDERRLFLHQDDTTGFLVKKRDGELVIDWFGEQYTYTPPAYNRSYSEEALLSWARKNCDWNPEELQALGGCVLRSPIDGSLHAFSLRGNEPRVYGHGKILGEQNYPVSLVSPHDFRVSLVGTVLEITHSRYPAWSFFGLSEDHAFAVIQDYFFDLDKVGVLVRDDYLVPVVVGNLDSLHRMSEEVPHKHKIFNITDWKEVS